MHYEKCALSAVIPEGNRPTSAEFRPKNPLYANWTTVSHLISCSMLSSAVGFEGVRACDVSESPPGRLFGWWTRTRVSCSVLLSAFQVVFWGTTQPVKRIRIDSRAALESRPRHTAIDIGVSIPFIIDFGCL